MISRILLGCFMVSVLRGNGIDRALAKPHDPVIQEAVTSPASAELPVESERPLSLLILSDIRFMREALADVLGREAQAIRTVSVVADIGEAIALMRADLPDLILIDAALPDGLAAARRLRSQAPGIQLIVLAVAETEAEVIAWAEAGASGYVP